MEIGKLFYPGFNRSFEELSSIEVKNEPEPKPVANLMIDDPYQYFKHIQISWNEGVLDREDYALPPGTDYDVDGNEDFHSYTGNLHNTLYFKVYMNDVLVDVHRQLTNLI